MTYEQLVSRLCNNSLSSNVCKSLWNSTLALTSSVPCIIAADPGQGGGEGGEQVVNTVSNDHHEVGVTNQINDQHTPPHSCKGTSQSC